MDSIEQNSVEDDAEVQTKIKKLCWVKRSLSSLSPLFSEQHIEEHDGDESPSLWWPSLLFDDYVQFQYFYEDELLDENLETEGIITQRMLQNMLDGTQVGALQLLGRPMKEYLEIVENPTTRLAPYQLDNYLMFTELPQDVYLEQMKPDPFICKQDVNGNVSDIIDDKLFMSYMSALDLVFTKRVSGPHAPDESPQSRFRDKGTAELAHLPSSIKKFSETLHGMTATKGDLGMEVDGKQMTEVCGDDSNDRDESDSEDESTIRPKVKEAMSKKKGNDQVAKDSSEVRVSEAATSEETPRNVGHEDSDALHDVGRTLFRNKSSRRSPRNHNSEASLDMGNNVSSKKKTSTPKATNKESTVSRAKTSPPGGHTVTPTSDRPRRKRRPPPSADETFETPKKKKKQFEFKSPSQEKFYDFSTLIKKLQKKCDWKYVRARLHNWQYVLPGCKSESQGGKHLVDFFYTEGEVIEYCMANDYYSKRQIMGLDDQ